MPLMSLPPRRSTSPGTHPLSFSPDRMDRPNSHAAIERTDSGNFHLEPSSTAKHSYLIFDRRKKRGLITRHDGKARKFWAVGGPHACGDSRYPHFDSGGGADGWSMPHPTVRNRSRNLLSSAGSERRIWPGAEEGASVIMGAVAQREFCWPSCRLLGVLPLLDKKLSSWLRSRFAPPLASEPMSRPLVLAPTSPPREPVHPKP